MKRLQLLVVFTTFLLFNAFSQGGEGSMSVEFGELSKIKSSTKLPITQVWPRAVENGIMYAYIPPFYEGKVVFSVPKKWRRRYMATISEDLQVTNYQEIVLAEDEFFEDVLWFNNSLCTFSRHSSEDMCKNVLSVNTINKSDLSINADKKELMNIVHDGSEAIEFIFFKYSLSPDSNKLLVTYELYKKSNVLSTGLAVFDTDFNELWCKEISEADLGTGAYLYNQFKVDNDGNVYANIDVYDTEGDYEDARKLRHGLGRELGFQSKYLKQSPNYTCYLVSYSNNGQTTTTYKLDSSDKKVRYIDFEPLDNQLKCVGLVSDHSRTSITGVTYFEIVKEQKGLRNVKHFDYDLAYILNGLNDKEAEKVKEQYASKQEFENGLYDLKLKFRNDGGFWLLAEHTDVSKEKMMAGPQGTLWLDCHHYKDISVLNFTKDGELIGKDKVNRLTFTKFENAMYGSYSAHLKDEQLFIFYNEVGHKGGVKWDYKKASLKAVQFDQNGKLNTQTLSTVAEQEVVAQPFNIGHFSEDILFFSGQETLKNRFIKVVL